MLNDPNTSQNRKNSIDEKENLSFTKTDISQRLDTTSLNLEKRHSRRVKVKKTNDNEFSDEYQMIMNDMENLTLSESNIKELDGLVSNYKYININNKNLDNYVSNDLSPDNNNNSNTNKLNKKTANFSTEKTTCNEILSLEDYLYKYVYLEDTVLNLLNQINNNINNDCTISLYNMNNCNVINKYSANNDKLNNIKIICKENKEKLSILLGEFNVLWGEHQESWDNETWNAYNKIREEFNYGNESVDVSLNISLFDYENEPLNTENTKISSRLQTLKDLDVLDKVDKHIHLDQCDDKLNCSNFNKLQLIDKKKICFENDNANNYNCDKSKSKLNDRSFMEEETFILETDYNRDQSVISSISKISNRIKLKKFNTMKIKKKKYNKVTPKYDEADYEDNKGREKTICGQKCVIF
jgi:hypothetical protein